MQTRTFLSNCLLAFSVLIAAETGYSMASGNPDIVGILATITEPGNAAELGLTQEQLDRLDALIKQHESQALTFSSEIRRLPSAERRVKESENIRAIEVQGFAMLTEAQKATAEMWRLQKLGPAALVEPEIAKLMGVSDEQVAKIKNILEGKRILLREMGATKGAAELNTRIVAALDETQKSVWQTVVGKPFQNESTNETESSAGNAIAPSASDVAVKSQSIMTGPENGLVIDCCFTATSDADGAIAFPGDDSVSLLDSF